MRTSGRREQYQDDAEVELEVAADQPPAEDDGRPALAPHLTVADGFRFGCGLLLSFVAFGCVAAILTAGAVLLALLLGLPIPFFTGP